MAEKNLLELKNKCSQDQRAISHRQAGDLYRRARIVVDRKANRLALL